MKKITRLCLLIMTLLFSFFVLWSHAQKTIVTNPTDNTVTVYPTAAAYNTGTTSQYNKINESIVYAAGGYRAGWFKFDVSSIPVGSIINSVSFHGYVYGSVNTNWSMTPCTVDPVTADAATLWADINAESSTGYYLQQLTLPPSIGWWEYELGGTANTDLQSAVIQGWFAMGMVSLDMYGIGWDGWNEANVPYLVIDHTLPLLDTKVLLEGPFNGIDMNTDLYDEGLIPLDQPYNMAPWNYPGTENVASIPNPDIVDWILLEFREAISEPCNALPDSIITRKAAFLLKNGQVVDLDGISLLTFDFFASDNYYLVIWHRNHLSVMSSVPLVESSGTYSYDFTDQLSKAYEDGQKEIATGVFSMVGGDCNANGIIENEDKNSCWTEKTGKTGYIPGDWDLNAQVSNPDKNEIWTKNLGKSSSVPPGKVYNPATGRIWMDRNLGASQVATISQDADAYGDIYQWGRFSEGHEIRTSGTTSTTAFTPVPNDGNPWDGLFITGSDDWLNSQDNTLWQGVSSNNNPCPSKFRLPTKEEWEAEMASWSSPNAAGAFDSPLKLTVAGYRSSGDASLKRVGTRGYYMSSTINEASTSIWRLRIAHDAYISTNYRATGFSVRCIKALPPEPPTDPIPIDGSTEMGINTNISWTCTNPNDYKYNVYFGMDSNPPFVADNLDETSYDPGTLDYNTTYYWKVTAFDNYGDSAVSNIWNFTTILSPPAIGDYTFGGVVFYLDGSGGGLVCAISDQSTGTEWGCYGTGIPGADGTAIGTGAQNTIDIEAGCTTAGIAADICANLTLNGYTDWFLPSKDELNAMHLNKATINATAMANGGSAFVSTYYWGSSEYNNYYAWLRDFSAGYMDYDNKSYASRVRAVRAF